jgi:hypothetical protein
METAEVRLENIDNGDSFYVVVSPLGGFYDPRLRVYSIVPHSDEPRIRLNDGSVWRLEFTGNH